MRVLTYFYVPLYLTAICSILVCLRSTGTPFFRESTSGHAVFIASWFDSGYIQSGTLLSCGGDSFSPDVAYSSSLDSVMPMKGKHTISYLQYHEYGSGIPSLEQEVQWDFQSSQLQLRSSLWCRSQSLWLIVPSLPLRQPFPRALRQQIALLRGCLRRGVVWWWRFFSRWCLRFCVGQRFADEGIVTFNYFQYLDVVGCVAMSCGGGFTPCGLTFLFGTVVKPMTGNFFLFPVPRGR